MAKISSFEEFVMHELQDTYSAETQILEAFPKMIAAATSPELKQAFEAHQRETEGQAERLRKIFKLMGEDPSGNPCEAAQGLIQETEEHIKEIQRGPVLDAALIASAQRFEHYEIASYGTAVTFAEQLKQSEAAELLKESLNEEEQTDKKLTQLAEKNINAKAAAAK